MESERLRLEVEALMANPEQQGLKQKSAINKERRSQTP